MATINQSSFYVNLVTLNREEAAVALCLILGALSESDEVLDAMGANIGIKDYKVRDLLLELGNKIDDNFEDMLKLAKEYM